jgi:hypothetical protein
LAKFIGNCSSTVNFNKILSQCCKNGPEYVAPLDRKFNDLPDNDPIKKIWLEKYLLENEGGTIAWDMFFPGKQFESDLLKPFFEFINVLKPTAVWITRIRPGNFAPIHWDVRKNETELDGLKFSRYHCHLAQSEPGHVFIVDDNLLYNSTVGDVYLWEDRKSIHAGVNFGLKPKWMLHAW